MLVPVEISRANVAEEIEAAKAWAARRNWALEVDLEGLRLRGTVRHPKDGKELFLDALLDDYKAVPPIWLFVTEKGEATDPSSWPSGGSVGGSSSIFHSVGVICAHFSRRAYREFNGPHGTNWGSATGWLEVQEGVRATTIADMLAVIDVHLVASPGRMG